MESLKKVSHEQHYQLKHIWMFGCRVHSILMGGNHKSFILPKFWGPLEELRYGFHLSLSFLRHSSSPFSFRVENVWCQLWCKSIQALSECLKRHTQRATLCFVDLNPLSSLDAFPLLPLAWHRCGETVA